MTEIETCPADGYHCHSTGRGLKYVGPHGVSKSDPLPMIRATHWAGYRSGEWAQLMGIEWIKGRVCYQVRFSDGKTDSWVIYDESDPYEFRAP